MLVRFLLIGLVSSRSDDTLVGKVYSKLHVQLDNQIYITYYELQSRYAENKLPQSHDSWDTNALLSICPHRG